MSAQKESHPWAMVVGIIVVAPVVYLALFFPLMSLTVRINRRASGYVLMLYRPIPIELNVQMFQAWRRMDPQGVDIVRRWPLVRKSTHR